MKDLALRSPVSLAVALNATSPAPPTGQRPIIWSTTTSSYLGWNGTNWVAVAGAGGGSSPDERVSVDWYIDEVTAGLVFTHAGLLINFSHFAFSLLDAPTTGQLVYLRSTANPADEGVYTIGSVASLGAVPLTRHADWPDTRVIQSGLRVTAFRSISSKPYYFDPIDFDSTPANTTDDLITFNTKVLNITDGSAFLRFTSPSGSLPSPLTAGTFYALGSPASDYTAPLKTDLVSYVNVNLTTAGTGTADCEVFSAISATCLTLIIGGPYTGGRDYIDRTFRFVDLTAPAPLISGEGSASTGDFLSVEFSLASWINNNGLTVGYGSRALGGGVSVGPNASSSGGVAVGKDSFSYGESVAVGYAAVADRSFAVAIGEGARCHHSHSVSLGNNGATFNDLELVTRFFSGRFDGPSTAQPGNVFKIDSFLLGESTGTERYIKSFYDTTTPAGIALNGVGDSFNFTGTIIARNNDIPDVEAVWEVRGTAGYDDTSTPWVRYSSKLVSGQGAFGGWYFRLEFTVTGRLDVVVNGLAYWIVDFQRLHLDTSNWFAWYRTPAPQIRTDNAINVITSEALTAGNMVNLHSSSGAKCRKADADLAYSADGYVLQDYGSGDEATVYISGENPMLSGLTVGPVYLSATAGGVTSTPPGTGNLVQRVGFALSATKMLFQRETPIQT